MPKTFLFVFGKQPTRRSRATEGAGTFRSLNTAHDFSRCQPERNGPHGPCSRRTCICFSRSTLTTTLGCPIQATPLSLSLGWDLLNGPKLAGSVSGLGFSGSPRTARRPWGDLSHAENAPTCFLKAHPRGEAAKQPNHAIPSKPRRAGTSRKIKSEQRRSRIRPESPGRTAFLKASPKIPPNALSKSAYLLPLTISDLDPSRGSHRNYVMLSVR
jgi:hypothetical protein